VVPQGTSQFDRHELPHPSAPGSFVDREAEAMHLAAHVHPRVGVLGRIA
jgi:hypothetical protein